MKRRAFVRTAAAAALGALSQPLPSLAADVEIELSPGNAGPIISPHIYGHFIEHLGGVIYDGVWVGRNSSIPNVDGIRKQFVDDMKRIGAPNLRWPGGCFADGYHWRDGIGKASARPRTYNYWQRSMPPGMDATETNQFGVQEFMHLCRLVGAEPYLAANVGSGSPREFHEWVQYCNSPAGTVSLAAERAANGDPEPYRVRYWGVGNESWGCGGAMKPEEYATLYRRFVTQFPAYTEPFLVATGPRGHSADGDIGWTTGFFGAMRGAALPSGFSVHYYTDFRPTAVKAGDFTPAEWYEVFLRGVHLEKVIEDHWREMGKFELSPSHQTRGGRVGCVVPARFGNCARLHPERNHHAAGRTPHRHDVRHLQPARRQNRHGQCGADNQLYSFPVSGARRGLRADSRLLCFRYVPIPHGGAARAGEEPVALNERRCALGHWQFASDLVFRVDPR